MKSDSIIDSLEEKRLNLQSLVNKNKTKINAIAERAKTGHREMRLLSASSWSFVFDLTTHEPFC